MLIATMNQIFENIVAKVLSVAHKVVQKVVQVSKTCEISLNCFKIWYGAYLDGAYYEYQQRFSNYCLKSASNGTERGTKMAQMSKN